jgi:hypothetical protein
VAPETTSTYSQLYGWYKKSVGTIVQASSSVDLLTGTSARATLTSCSGTSDQVVGTIAYGISGVANKLGVTASQLKIRKQLIAAHDAMAGQAT